MRGLFILALSLLSLNTFAAGSKIDIPKYDWSWKGFFGTYDRASAQRGLKVYREVCAGCHSMDLIAYRNLADLGFSEAHIKAIAAEYLIPDGPNDEGEMFEREAIPSDRFANPYPNVQAARAANNGAYPPDLSLIVKARANGADYLYSLLNGYKDYPENFEASEGMYYNEFYPGYQIAMPSPLMDDIVEYDDGTEATHSQIAKDITSFLAWTAEPELEERKSLGVKTLFFLILITIMLLGVKRKVWKDLD